MQAACALNPSTVASSDAAAASSRSQQQQQQPTRGGRHARAAPLARTRGQWWTNGQAVKATALSAARPTRAAQRSKRAAAAGVTLTTMASTAAEEAAKDAGAFIPAAPILLPPGDWTEVEGGVAAAKGFKAYGIHAGLRAAGKKPDLAVVVADDDAVVGATFTQNVMAAAPVAYCKWALEQTNTARAVVINAGQANAATGDAGYADAVECAESFAKILGVPSSSVLIQSTGVIGQPIKKAPLLAALPSMVSSASSSPAAALAAAVAITTTDLVSKSVAVETKVGGQSVRLGGMCKGSGMIHPNMATMLGVVTCDAAVTAEVWQPMVRTAVSRSFNQITVDGDTSTNDCVIALASGKSGAALISDASSAEAQQLQAAMDAVFQGLAKSIAWDGEGATCLIEVSVSGASTEADAAIVARSVAASSLAKAAVYGRDPNWGRIACAAGYSGVEFDPNLLRIQLGDIVLMEKGQPLPFDRAAASGYLKSKGDVHGTVNIDISIGAGPGSSKAWGCDLSYDYVKINAEYTT